MSDMRLKGACPGRWCGCFACSLRRAEMGLPPLPIVIGRHRIETLPLEDDDEPSDRRPAALAVIGAMALFGAVCALGWLL